MLAMILPKTVHNTVLRAEECLFVGYLNSRVVTFFFKKLKLNVATT